MRTAFLCLFAALSLGFVPARAGTLEEQFRNGVQALREGRPDQAAETFRELRDRYQVGAPEVLLNLAAAEFEAGRPGRAIVSLHRAIRVDPEGPVGQAARVSLARARNLLSEQASRRSNAFVFSPYSDAWTLLAGWASPTVASWAFLGIWSAFFLVLAALRLPRLGAWRRFLAGPVVALGIATLVTGGLTWASHRVASYTIGVVVEPEVGLLPDPVSMEPRMTLPEGLEVRVLENRGGLVHVRLSSGEEGFLAPRAIEIP